MKRVEKNVYENIQRKKKRNKKIATRHEVHTFTLEVAFCAFH